MVIKGFCLESTSSILIFCKRKYSLQQTDHMQKVYAFALWRYTLSFPYTESCHNERNVNDIDDSICNYVPTDNTSSCVSATLQCENMMCSAVISNYSRTCHFVNIGYTMISQTIQCCFCNNNIGLPPIEPWWDCENVTTPTPSLQISPSLSTGECINTTTLHYCVVNTACY